MPILSFVQAMIEPSTDIRAAVTWAIENGFHGVEISGRSISPNTLSTADIDWLIAQATEYGITYTIHFPMDTAPGSHDLERWNRDLDVMKLALQIAGKISCPVIVLHPGPIDNPGIEPLEASEGLRQESIENLRRFLREAAPHASEAGTAICLENMHHRQGDVIQSYQDLIDLVDTVDHPNIKITLDVGHAFIHDGLPEAIAAFGDRIHHIHLDDALNGKDHLPIGKGELNLDLYADMLQPGKTIVATMEVGRGPGAQLVSREALRARFGEIFT